MWMRETVMILQYNLSAESLVQEHVYRFPRIHLIATLRTQQTP